MSLTDDIKVALRVVSDDFDIEVDTLIDAALYDMERAGVNPALLDREDLENAFVRQAVTVWCKAHFGYDVSEAYRFEAAYDRILNALLNSVENIAAIAEEPVEEEE